ncbi:ABC transporter ATP-binding protein [Rhodopila globiformis]|uniref:Ferrichrome ABC transporter n=1 Tax=Rhodopila globiformis TaxID=1071 RepID=A0A2S6NMT8_RHOGL|nr:ABC transporter ATP-binding protein [Rhodopila globiformis]PPQ37766.1 ferrichrome ABC transporter [Rhodopila globiformis]
MPDPAIAFAGLGHAFRPGQWVFRRCTASIGRGRVVALLGANGRGKTTLLRLLLGVLRPTEGRLALHGRAAFVPQTFQLGFDYAVLDVVLMGRARQVGLLAQPSARDKAAALQALDHFGLGHLAARPFHELSGGQRQLVMFARAVVSEADILILDEPASALDLRNQAVILDWIRRLSRRRGLTVLFSTHHPQHALEVADDALLMLERDGLAFGPVDEVLSEANLLALYGIPLRRVAFDYGGETLQTLAAILRPAGNAPAGDPAPHDRSLSS